MADNNLKDIDIFDVSQMEIVMNGGDPSKACYRNINTSSSLIRGELSSSEKSKIKNYTVLNTSEFKKNCNALYETAETEFSAIARELRELKDKCGKDVFSLNEETMQDDFEEVAKAIENYLLQIREYTNALIAKGKSVSSKQEVVYENTVRWMNILYEKNKPKVEKYTNPQNLTVIK